MLSTLIFFYSAQVALTIYIDSSFLSETIKNLGIKTGMWSEPSHVVGILYTAGSLMTVLALMVVPYILEKVGNYRATLTAVILHTLMLFGLGLTDSPWLIVPMFIMTTVLTSVLYFNFDIFIERYSHNEDTGKIRAIFATFGSLAWLVPPLLAGYIVEARGFQTIYLVAGVLLLPMIFVIMHFLNHFKDMKYDHASLLMTREEVLHNKNIYNILFVNFFIHFFFAWMVIYTPLYLTSLGFHWEEIGLMLTIALTAFVIYPYPAGWLADKYLGEKELLMCGFLLMSISVLLFPLFGDWGLPFIAWAALLFLGRTGASISEIMSETYFFKQIDGKNTQLVGYFRRTRPLAFIVAPVIATILLEVFNIEIKVLFQVLGFILVFALWYISRITDTK